VAKAATQGIRVAPRTSSTSSTEEGARAASRSARRTGARIRASSSPGSLGVGAGKLLLEFAPLAPTELQPGHRHPDGRLGGQAPLGLLTRQPQARPGARGERLADPLANDQLQQALDEILAVEASVASGGADPRTPPRPAARRVEQATG
jgi:hypothetical protein